MLATSFDGIDRSNRIDVVGADGRLLKRITFRGPGELNASDLVTSGFVQDHWQVGPRLALDLGLRYDQDAMLGESHLSPRTAFSLALDPNGRTLVNGGWGFFFDQVFLQVDAFDRFQQRVEQDFNGTADAPASPPSSSTTGWTENWRNRRAACGTSSSTSSLAHQCCSV